MVTVTLCLKSNRFEEMPDVSFVSSETQVFYENMRNSSCRHIHILGKDFLPTATVSSDSSVYYIHIFCASEV